MNQLVRLVALAGLALGFLAPAGAEDLIDQLYAQRQYELADAYWAAGARFSALGQADRGAEFQAAARRLFPGFVPGQAPTVVRPAPAPVVETPAAVPAAAEIREQNLQGQKIARLQFQKLLRGYLTGNVAAIEATLAPEIVVQGQSTPVDRQALQAYLDAHPSEAAGPEDLFVAGSLEVADGEGQAVVVTVRAAEGTEAWGQTLPFWKPTQRWTFDRAGATWKLRAVEGE